MNDKFTATENEEHIPGKCSCDLCIRSSQALGSLTGWLLNTSALSKDTIESESSFCSKCNKKIDNPNVGSLTQWIFKHELCKCSQAEQASNSRLDINPFEERINLGKIESIEAPEGFPKERFIPVAKVATGNTGTIYRAVDNVLCKTVAIKTINIINNQQFIDFQNEAKAISVLDHPNIVKVFDFSVSEGGTPYMVMEYIDGVPLTGLIESKSLTQQETIDLFVEITDALLHAHSQNILHRDLKPDNILIETRADQKFKAKVVDFGLAKISLDSQVSTGSDKSLAGTPQYMSPDCAMGLKFDQRSDIYSLGSILYECLAGHPPFKAENAMELLAKKSQELPEPIRNITEEVAPELDKLVAKALEPEISRRYQSMQELKDALLDLSGTQSESVLQAHDQSVKGQSQSQGLQKFPWRAVSVFVCLLLISSVFVYRNLFQDSKTPEPLQTKQFDSYYEPDYFDLKQVGDFHSQPYKEMTVYVASKSGANISDLYKLDKIDGIIISSSKITPDDIDKLKNKNIKVLKLKSCVLSQKALNKLGELNELSELNLESVGLKDCSIDFLESLKKLKSLSLTDTNISAEQLKVLRKIPLESVRVSGNEFKDDALNYLAEIPTLKDVTVSANDITERGLIKLRNLKNLKLIVAKYCDAVSNQAPLHLKKYMPEVTIIVTDKETLFPEIKKHIKKVY